MASSGLQLALTLYGLYDVIVPHIFRLERRKSQLDPSWISLILFLRLKYITTASTAARLKKTFLKRIGKSGKSFLKLPYEIREQVYQHVCRPQSDGKVPGASHVLLLNKQIRREALNYYEQIPHRIVIADLSKAEPETPEYLGVPYILKNDWYLTSLKHLIIEVRICSLGTMTPDTFDVNISKAGKHQWKSLKRLVGIWPEVREQPLESLRLDLKLSQADTKYVDTYRADFIRVLRNFKRTRIWAETGDCGGKGKNTSVLLPLVRAFNQGRRNWVEESDGMNNLLVRYDKQVLSKVVIPDEDVQDIDAVEMEQEKWSVVPVEDTSRSDNATWPEWTDKEEKYVSDKMVLRKRALDMEWECKKCLAVFDRPRELREHRDRGAER